MEENRGDEGARPGPGDPGAPPPAERRDSSDTTMSFAAITPEAEAEQGRLSGDEVRSIEALPPRSALLLVQTELVLVLDGDLLPQVARRTDCSIVPAKYRGACSCTGAALQSA